MSRYNKNGLNLRNGKDKLVSTFLLLPFFLMNLEVQFEPDISINGQLFLIDVKSTKQIIGELNHFLDKDESLPDAYFSNPKIRNQYLLVIFHPGGMKNSISEFEVGFPYQ